MKKLAGLALLSITGVLALLEFSLLIDPAGFKVADDLDPFGDPHVAWYQHVVFIFIIVFLGVIAARLWRGTRDQRR